MRSDRKLLLSKSVTERQMILDADTPKRRGSDSLLSAFNHHRIHFLEGAKAYSYVFNLIQITKKFSSFT